MSVRWWKYDNQSYGKILVACTDGKEEVAGALLAREPLDSFRKRFPVLDDGDDFELL